MTKTLSNASAKTDSNTSGCMCSINETNNLRRKMRIKQRNFER